MAIDYNFSPLEYNPYKYETTIGSRPVVASGEDYPFYFYPPGSNPRRTATKMTPQEWDIKTLEDQRAQFHDYADPQFSSLFDAINQIGTNPIVTGETLGNVPQYSPFQGTRADFTTGGQQAPTVFDQQAYIDARFGNINDYLGRMGSFFGNMAPQQSQSQAIQNILANAPSQGPRPMMPTVGSNLNLGGGTHAGNPFPSFGAGTGGGWGTPPTSLFGAGANATIP